MKLATDFEKDQKLNEAKVKLENGIIFSFEIKKRQLILTFVDGTNKMNIPLTFNDVQEMNNVIKNYLKIFG